MPDRLIGAVRQVRGPDFYDRNARKRGFRAHYTKSQHYPVWSVIADRLRPLAERAVLEIGCGTGQLAELLADQGLSSYVGFDFSTERITTARERVPQLRFEVADAFDTDLYAGDYDTVVCTEFLEHVENDVALFGLIRPRVRFVGTVPNYDAEAHVRYFASAHEVAKRYGPLLAESDVTQWQRREGKVLYLIDGVTA